MAVLPGIQSGCRHACVLIALFPRLPLEMSALLLFMAANKPLTFSVIGFFFFLERDGEAAPWGSRRAASPQGCLLEGEGWPLSSCSKIQALSLANSTNFCSWLWLTFLLMLRDVSKGFWMYRGEESGLFCSLPYRQQRRNIHGRRGTRPEEAREQRTAFPRVLATYVCTYTSKYTPAFSFSHIVCEENCLGLWSMNDDVNAQVIGIWTRSTTKILFT